MDGSPRLVGASGEKRAEKRRQHDTVHHAAEIETTGCRTHSSTGPTRPPRFRVDGNPTFRASGCSRAAGSPIASTCSPAPRELSSGPPRTTVTDEISDEGAADARRWSGDASRRCSSRGAIAIVIAPLHRYEKVAKDPQRRERYESPASVGVTTAASANAPISAPPTSPSSRCVIRSR